jgi:hypothetical protein
MMGSKKYTVELEVFPMDEDPDAYEELTYALDQIPFNLIYKITEHSDAAG